MSLAGRIILSFRERDFLTPRHQSTKFDSTLKFILKEHLKPRMNTNLHKFEMTSNAFKLVVKNICLFLRVFVTWCENVFISKRLL